MHYVHLVYGVVLVIRKSSRTSFPLSSEATYAIYTLSQEDRGQEDEIVY
jgi:hypothetical protein